jgi:hypothetical protein
MGKLNKQVYYNSKGEKKINCYHIIVSKEIVAKAGINEDDEIEVKAQGKKIIVEKKEG